MDEIKNDLVDEVKERLHISHDSEDNHLQRFVAASLDDLKEKCGTFDAATNLRARELVLERVRYAYNDSLEFFDENFLMQIQSLSLSLLPSVDEEGDALD